MKLPYDICAHYLIPDFSNDFFEDIPTPVHIGLPYPIHKPFKYSENDVIQSFHTDFEKYSNQFQTLCKEFPLSQDTILSQSFEDSHIVITQGLLDFYNTEKSAKHLPYYYNPYYASGILAFFNLHNNKHLVRPDCKNKLCVSNIAKPWKLKKLNLQNESEEDISGLHTSCTTSDVYLLIKRNTEINFFQVRDVNEQAQITWNKKFKRKILDSKSNNTEIGVVLANKYFKLYDIETSKKINFIDQNVHLVTRLEFVNENVISLLNEDILKIVDHRSRDYTIFEPELNDCNRLCSVKFDGNLIYLASRHHLLKTDRRFLRTVDYCTHLMKNSPCYIDLVQNNNEKFLCLASQKGHEKVLFNGNSINSLPFGVPSIYDSLFKCQRENDITLVDELEKRFNKSVGGIKLFSDNNDLILYSVNSLGDVFAQNISKEPGDTSTVIENLHYWISKLPNSSKQLYLTNVANLSNARFALNQRTLDERLTKFCKKSKKTNLFLNHFNNVYNKSNLGDLAANFVAIWDDEEEKSEKVPEFVPEVAPLDKVSSWIESSYFIE